MGGVCKFDVTVQSSRVYCIKLNGISLQILVVVNFFFESPLFYVGLRTKNY